jgi:PIN domain nuclease of toxin-antitoxin system
MLLIWVLTDAPQLDASSRSVIANAEGVWFSEASIWERGLKWRNGKIAIQPRRLADQAFGNGLRPLPIQMEPLLA